MTVGYMKDVATANSFTFLRLLFRWRGSVWKAIYWELLLWMFLFENIRIAYDFLLVDTHAGDIFEQVVIRCREIIGNCRTIMTFALGFYVTFVTNRWWNVFMTIPWPDTAALQLTAYLRTRGKLHEAEDKSLRQTIMRYLLLSYVLVFRDVSVRIRKRFPTYDHLTPTLMTNEESMKLENYTESRHWVPIQWALGLLRAAEKKGCIDKYHLADVTKTILNYRQQLHEILSYDWISVPLVYVQAVNICTMSYFFISCLASQTTYDPNDDNEEKLEIMENFVPVYAIIEFVVFNGWLKTAFAMLNPFGLDDDDFEVDAMIERNLEVSLSYVNDFFDKPPKLVDMHVKLPHTIQSAAMLKKANPMHGSAVPVDVPKHHQHVLNEHQASILEKLVSPSLSKTNLQNPAAKHDFQQKWTFNDETDEKQLKGPEISTKEEKETTKKFILKNEDLEAAITKLLEKRLAEEEKITTQRTQSVSIYEEPTQLSQNSRKVKNDDGIRKKKPSEAVIKQPAYLLNRQHSKERAPSLANTQRRSPRYTSPQTTAPVSKRNKKNQNQSPGYESQATQTASAGHSTQNTQKD